MNIPLHTLLQYARVSLGIIFLWYGSMKFFPELLQTQELAQDSISMMAFGFIPSAISIKLLAIFEVIIGLGFIFALQTKTVVMMLLSHMIITFSALFFLPEFSFGDASYSISMAGQYISKNILFILIALMIYQDETISQNSEREVKQLF